MKVLALIPARMGSTRFPGKPMAPIMGTPMIEHVYKNVACSTDLDLVAVATCDKEIFDHIESIGGVAVMTGSHHERATDRSSEALQILEEKNNTQYDVVIMVQGDEPMTHPDMISEVLLPMKDDKRAEIATNPSTMRQVLFPVTLMTPRASRLSSP